MSLRKRSKECLPEARRIFEVNLNLIRCMVKIMNSDGMAEKKVLMYYKILRTGNVFVFKNSLQFFIGEKLIEMSEQLSMTISF